ncbi:MAG: metallophosphoesterase family protein [Flavobacteriaceae bacterium]|nr:metallophosphoesterase family protein [Flavobacteriaceae bacterium]
MMQHTMSLAFKKAHALHITKHSKVIIFSDCHRGNNSYADDFSHNSKIYKHALDNYCDKDFTYIELGDGIELWENNDFSEILTSYKDVFDLLLKFHDKNQLYLLWGNHDMVFKKKKNVSKILGSYLDKNTGKRVPLFTDLSYYESLRIHLDGFKQSIFLMHGHQADFFNYHCWKLSRFLVRYLWKPLQRIGYKDPTSPAKNHKELIRVEKRIKKWIQHHDNQMVITGHTHRPRFPRPDELPYFNDGSCVHPKSITGLEIVGLNISLIKWETITSKEGKQKIGKTIIEGPTPLHLYLGRE